MGMNWRGIGLAAVVLAGVGAGRVRADFVALAPTSGLSQNSVASPAGPPTVTYSDNLGLVSFSRFSSLTYRAEVDKFSLAALAGARITSATLTLDVYVAQSLDSGPIAFNITTFGSASSTASPADFQSGINVYDRMSYPLNLSPAMTQFRFERTAALQSLVDGKSAAVGFGFAPSVPGNISFGNLVLNVTYQPAAAAVPEPSSLALGLIAGGIGLAAGRRRILRRAG